MIVIESMDLMLEQGSFVMEDASICTRGSEGAFLVVGSEKFFSLAGKSFEGKAPHRMNA